MNELYQQYYAELVYYGLKFIPYNEPVVNDIVVNAIMKISEKDYKEKKFVLYRVVKNNCLNYLKSKKRFVFDENIPDESYEIDYESHLIEIDVLKILLSAYKQLPEETRIVLGKLYWEGKNPVQAARELGKSVSTIRSIKQYGLDRLYKLIYKKTPEELRNLLNIKKHARQHH